MVRYALHLIKYGANDGFPMAPLKRQWSARTLRLTVFLQSPVDAINPDTWERATGEKPMVDQNLPRQLTRVQGGPIGAGFLTFQVQGAAQRLDWTMAPPPPDDASGVFPATEFGPVEAALSEFNRVVRNWLTSTEISSNRLAVGVIAAIPVPDRVAAYKALQEYIPSVKLDPEHSRELLYRINRPKPSRSLGSEVELNRMTMWSASQIRAVGPTGPIAGFGGFYVAVECDNSTPAERQPALDNAKFVDIYDELMEMAFQNLEHGELP